MSSVPSPRTSVFALGVLAVLLEGVFLWLRRFHPFDQNVLEVIFLGLLAGVLYLLAAFWVLRFSDSSRRTLLLIIAAALVFRGTLLPLEPSLSTDLYRYLWEGKIQLAGHNPYLSAPHDPALVTIPSPGLERIPGSQVPAAYGPVTELLFWLTASLNGVIGFKLLSLVFDLAVLFMLIGLLRVSQQPLGRALLYGWCPLVVLEFAGSGHNDSLPLAALLLASLLLITRQPVVSIVALAIATLSKWFAGVAAPLFLWRSRWRSVPLFLAVGLLCLLPYGRAGGKLATGLLTYAAQWRNNESLFALLRAATGEDVIATGIGLGVVAGLALHLAVGNAEPLRACLVLLAAMLLFSPSVFPWYVTWIVPFLCFYPHPGLLLFTSTVLLSYHPWVFYNATGEWRYEPALIWLEYAPVYGLLLWGWWKNVVRGRRGASSGPEGTPP